MDYKQQERILEITTILGADKAMLVSIEGEDRVSQPYEFRLCFVTTANEDEVNKLLGTAVSIRLGDSREHKRDLHGVVRRLRRGRSDRLGIQVEWHAEVVPVLWFLSQTTDLRIFQQKTIPDIIADILGMHGVSEFDLRLMGSYQPRDYVVQYRESALAFIQRLMEQEGIFYWHEHTASAHKLVLADDNAAATRCPKGPFSLLDHGSSPAAISRLDYELVVRSGKWSTRDFNFETPSTRLEASEPTTIDVAEMKRRERYDYPGIFETPAAGKGVAKRLIENQETFHNVWRGESLVIDFTAGHSITIEKDGEDKFLLTEVSHRAEDFSHWTEVDWGSAPRAPSYSNLFVCIPQGVRYKPERTTPRPVVQGPQTAIVTGPAGEEIYTDKYGRVKVQFHWDREGKKDENSSCWVRVSQGIAGKGWGQMHIPRIGQEVIVDFLEGDPDRPIITGRVYNAENTVPYDLPANKTQSGIKTNSSMGGGGSNEIRLEDMKGAEQIYVHAQFNLDTVVENNETRHVVVDRTTNIDGNETETVKGNRTRTVNGNETVSIDGNRSQAVKGNETYETTGNRTYDVNGKETISITGDQTVTVNAKQDVVVSADATLDTSANRKVTAAAKYELSAANVEVTASGSVKIVVGASSIEMTPASITISSGASSVKLDAAGVSVMGPKISLNG